MYLNIDPCIKENHNQEKEEHVSKWLQYKSVSTLIIVQTEHSRKEGSTHSA